MSHPAALETFASLQPGDRVEVTHEIKVGFRSWNTKTIGNVIVVDPRTGTLYDFFDFITPPFNITAFKAAFVKSTDGGDTWTRPQIIADILVYCPILLQQS